MAGSYRIGQLVEVGTEFRDPNTKALVDPSVVRLRVLNPAKVIVHVWLFGTDPEIVKDAVGKYHANVDGNASGTWYYYWYSTATGQAAEEGKFTILAAKAAP